MAKDDDKKIDFEGSLARLEELVAQLERGDLTLEQTLEQFESGMALASDCQEALAVAEQKVKILLDKRAEGQPVDLDPET